MGSGYIFYQNAQMRIKPIAILLALEKHDIILKQARNTNETEI